jgi:hypothetical protein
MKTTLSHEVIELRVKEQAGVPLQPPHEINEPNRKLKSSIKLKNTKAPFPIVADMFAQKRLCRITVKVIKNSYRKMNLAGSDWLTVVSLEFDDLWKSLCFNKT